MSKSFLQFKKGDYGLAEARTTYGVIGVKVWIFKGEVLDASKEAK